MQFQVRPGGGRVLRIAKGLNVPVSLKKLQPQMAVAANVISGVYKELAGADCYITSGDEGEHSANSLHYEGLALDFRIRNVAPRFHGALSVEIMGALSDEYDVVLEETHVHVEYDPT